MSLENMAYIDAYLRSEACCLSKVIDVIGKNGLGIVSEVSSNLLVNYICGWLGWCQHLVITDILKRWHFTYLVNWRRWPEWCFFTVCLCSYIQVKLASWMDEIGLHLFRYCYDHNITRYGIVTKLHCWFYIFSSKVDDFITIGQFLFQFFGLSF